MYWANPVAWQRQSQLQLRPIAVMIVSCKDHVRGLKNLISQASYVFLLKRSHVLHVTYMRHNSGSRIYGEYLANVHFIDIPHTFIPHFTLHSAKKNPHQIFRKLPLDNFQHSAIRIPQNTPSPLRIYFHIDFCPLITTLCLRPVRNDRMTGST